MKLRIEFLEARSSALPNVIRICKKFQSYKVLEEEGIKVHSVEFEGETIVSFEALWGMVRPWKGTVTYLDDRLVGPEQIYKALDKWRTSRENPTVKANVQRFLGLAVTEIQKTWEEDHGNN